MTLDAYGRYVGRHEAEWRPGDARHDLMAALYPGDGASEDGRYERPVFEQRAARVPADRP